MVSCACRLLRLGLKPSFHAKANKKRMLLGSVSLLFERACTLQKTGSSELSQSKALAHSCEKPPGVYPFASQNGAQPRSNLQGFAASLGGFAFLSLPLSLSPDLSSLSSPPSDLLNVL